MMEKNNGEEFPIEQPHGARFGLMQDTEGHYYAVTDHGVDLDLGLHPFDDETPAEQTTAILEAQQPIGKVVDDKKK